MPIENSSKRIFKTLVDVVDGPHGQQLLLDTVFWHENAWLVPRWQAAETAGTRRPVRLVRPELFRMEQSHSPKFGEDYFLACAIPKSILDGRGASDLPVKFLVVEAPELEYPIPKEH